MDLVPLVTLFLAFLVFLVVSLLHAKLGKGRNLATALSGSGLLAVTVIALFQLMRALNQ